MFHSARLNIFRFIPHLKKNIDSTRRLRVKTTSAGWVKKENGLSITSKEKNIGQNVSGTNLEKSIDYEFLPGY